jgi:hypothetical protein
MKKERKTYRKAGMTVGILGLVCIGFVIGLLVLSQSTQPIVENTVRVRTNRMIPLGDPVGDASGFCGFFHYPHQADPGTAYATNLTTGASYEYILSLSGVMTGETPHSTLYDYVVKIVVNDTVGYNTTSSSWEPDWIYMNMSVDLNFGSDIPWTQMTLVETTNTSDFCWYQGYLNNGGAGYTLSQNQKTNSSFNMTAWW